MRDINLTPREEQVLAQMIQGLSTNEIAERLNIGSETVSSYRRIMYKKLGARSAAQAVFKAFQLGILSSDTRVNPTNDTRNDPFFVIKK